MRLYRYARRAGGAPSRIAVAVDHRGPVDLIDAWKDAGGAPDDTSRPWLRSTLALIEAGPETLREVAAAVAGSSVAEVGEEQEVKWLCPFDKISSLRDFLAFESHVLLGAERRGTTVPDYWHQAPVYYKGNHRSIIGPGEECPWPVFTAYLDFELELAMVLGMGGRDVARDQAAHHIFGFTILNDFSARDVQAREMSAWLGPAKGKDFATALGPCIVTTDELGTEPEVEMVCRVNGERWGSGRSTEMRWRWIDMIAHVSKDEEIYPGDVYGSGTPGGCCGLDLGRKLAPGDVVELEIEGIGVLRNTIGDRSGRPPAVAAS